MSLEFSAEKAWVLGWGQGERPVGRVQTKEGSLVWESARWEGRGEAEIVGDAGKKSESQVRDPRPQGLSEDQTLWLFLINPVQSQLPVSSCPLAT